MNTTAPYLLLEINSPDIWRWSYFLDMVQTARKYNFHGIIIHQQQLLARLAAPSPQCCAKNIINFSLARENALLYLRRVSEYCNKQQLQLWLQGEATPDSQELKAKLPEFFRTDSSPADFIDYFFQHSIGDILAALPDVRGLRLSLSTPDMESEHWKNAIQGLYRKIRQLGRQLVLRDYQDKSWPRQMLHDVLATLPNDVRASLKATELDYRPGFATNPNLLNLSGNRKWLELDLWGMDYGWTLLPCYLVDEFQQRLAWLSQHPGGTPEAITVRIDWEWLPDLPLTESVNELNLFGLSRLIHQPELSSQHILTQWLQQRSDGQLARQDQDGISDIITTSHEWSCKTPNMLGRVLQCHSQLPMDHTHALHLLHMDTRSANWAQSFQPLMPTDSPEVGEQQRQLIELETQRSSFLAEYMYARSLKLLPGSALNDTTCQQVNGAVLRGLKYTQIYSAFTQTLMLKLWLRKYGEESSVREQFTRTLAVLAQRNRELEIWFSREGAQHPLSFTTLLNPDRTAGLITSLERD